MTILFFDVETLPTNDPALITEFSKSITAPGQYKKQDSIDAWLAENRESALKELVAKTSSDGLHGRIACTCWAFDDGEVITTLPADSEPDVLTKFYDSIVDRLGVTYHGGTASKKLTLCGHNIAGFDIPFLKHRSIVLGIKPPAVILQAMSAKPWDMCIADTMLMWSSERDKRVSMDKLCKVFGIPGKGDFDGSMIADTWPVDPQKVIDYCADDVRRTRSIYQRITFTDRFEERNAA